MGFDQDHRLVFRHAHAKLEHHVRIVLGHIGDHEVGFHEVVNDCGLNRSLPCLFAVLTVNWESLAAGVIRLRNTSAKKPVECFASRSTNGMITNAVSFDAPFASARVIVSGGRMPVCRSVASPAEAGMPDVIPRSCNSLGRFVKTLRGFPDEIKFLLERLPEVLHLQEDCCLYSIRARV